MSIESINKKFYIELNSTYRNRTLYPFQSSFRVNILNKGKRDTSETSFDPVSDGDSMYVWKGRQDTATVGFIGGVPSAPILNLGPTTTAFRGQILYLNNDLGDEQSSLVTFFSEYSKICFLETPFGADFDVTADTGFVPNRDSQSNIFLSMRIQSFPNQFVGQYLYDLTINEYRKISKYNQKFQMLTLSTPFSGAWTETDEYTIVKEPAISSGFVTFPTSITENTVTLPGSESSVDNIYKGQFIKFTQFTGPNILTTYSRLITNYDGTTKVVTFYPDIGLDFQLPFSQVNYQIIPYKEDIASYVNTIPCKETGLYRMSLLSLTIPNQVLAHPHGGTVTNFPYVYVTVTNVMNRTNSLINSNNPNSLRASFRCPVVDVDNQELNTFLKFGSEMVNVIFFDPSNELLFEVFLPDGTLLKTIQVDTSSPVRPNPLLQLSCLFTLEFIEPMTYKEYDDIEYEPNQLVEDI